MRGEINGLLQSWRDPLDARKLLGFIELRRGRKMRARAEEYDRNVAGALIVGLEGDLTGAGELLRQVKADILDKRTGMARLQYILCALSIVLFFVLAASLVASLSLNTQSCVRATLPLCFDNASTLWRGAVAGAVGAFFSIAISVKGRTVLTDLNLVSNLLDAALRVMIGIIAGVVLDSLILDHIIVVALGFSQSGEVKNATGQAGAPDDLYYAIAGFIAGFSERMVPDLLEKAEVKASDAPVVRTPAPDPGSNAAPSKQRAASGVAASNASTAPDAATATAIAAADADDADDHVDDCVASHPIAEDEVTPDEALPPAAGGVAAPKPA